MNPWLRGVIGAALLAVMIAGAGLSSPTPRLGREGKPDFPRLVRKGSAEPDLTAEAVLITRFKGGEVLYQRNAERRLPIASLTKLVTAFIVAEAIEPLEAVAFSEAAKRAGMPDEKRSAVNIGERLKAEDVLKLLLASSDTDAAYAAAEHVAARASAVPPDASFPERLAAFVAAMNETATALELADTHFANPTGSDDSMNFSTARDLAALGRAIWRQHPELWAITRIRETFVFGRDRQRYGVVNTNPLLGEYPAIYGSKTGFDDEARGALLLLYNLAPNDPIAIVLLRSHDRFGDGRAAIGWLEENFVIESEHTN